MTKAVESEERQGLLPSAGAPASSQMRRRRTDRVLAPLRVLMTLDAGGDIWRFGMDLARALEPRKVSYVFAIVGPEPPEAERREAEAIGEVVHLPLQPDAIAKKESDLAEVSARIAELADQREVDLTHLTLPALAAGLDTNRPVVVSSHSCVPTWFHAVRKTAPPTEWDWLVRLNQKGISRADAVLVPSRSHAELMEMTYGRIRNMRVVHHSAGPAPHPVDRNLRDGIVAVRRWSDEGDNGAVLDQVAARIGRPLTLISSDTGPQGENLAINTPHHIEALSQAKTLELIGNAEVFVSASLYDPFGLTVLEAAARRTPLVLADIPTYRELWEGAALFVPPHDPAAYVEAIEKLATERQLREILAQLASNRATRFTPVRQAMAMRAVYDSVVLPNVNVNAG